MKDKTFNEMWEELKAESPEIRAELEEAEKNSELMMDIIVAVRNLLDEKDSEKWISVEDWLPDTVRNVIACSDSGRVFECWYCAKDKLWVRHSVTLVENITHWRELPDPPKNKFD